MVTFEEILAEYGLDPQRASGGRELIIECPFCQRQKLYVNATTGLWLCYRCEERGNKWSLMERVLGLDGVRAGYYIRRIDPEHKLITHLATEPEVEIKPAWLPTGFVTLPAVVAPSYEAMTRGCFPYLDYLVGRRFHMEHVRRFHIGYAPGNPAYEWRVIVPVIMHGKLQSFVARSVYDECFRCHTEVCECPVGWQRVLYPPGSRMSELLFNLDGRGTDIVLVEGVFDSMRLPDLAVATFGSRLSPVQRGLLHVAGVRTVTVMFDGDEAGQQATNRVAAELRSDLFDVRIAQLPNGADPASLSEEEALKVVTEAEDYSFSLTRR